MRGNPSSGLRPVLLLLFAVVTLTPVSIAQPAPKYKILHAFGKGSDGGGLWSPVTFDRDGNLYGATSGGGAYAYGTVFQLSPHNGGRWSETILHSFKGEYDPGGGEPNGGLVQDASRNWYGTTNSGGAYYVGTVFELTHVSRGWKERVLYSFGTNQRDGGGPTSGLAADSHGSLYGTAPRSYSTGFELTRQDDGWTETILHHFGVKKGDGSAPYAGLILDASGNLYGTTRYGGSYTAGTVYELRNTVDGWREGVLHSFGNNGLDGDTPGWGALAMDPSGSLYGTTEVGGATGYGTIYRLGKNTDGSWKETILYDFNNGSTGWGPGAGVVMDPSGNLYGTTIYGGSTGCGVVYKLAPGPKDKWAYTVLHTFGYSNDGCQPDANLILDHKGNLYGTAATGGAYGSGVVFELTP